MAVHASSFVLCLDSSSSVMPLGVPSLQQNSVFLLLQSRIQSNKLQPFPSLGLGLGVCFTVGGDASLGLAGVSAARRPLGVFARGMGPGKVRVIGGCLARGLCGGVEMRASGQDIVAENCFADCFFASFERKQWSSYNFLQVWSSANWVTN